MMIPVEHRTTYTVTLAEENGRLRFERTLLLQQVLAVHAGLEDGTATAAWRSLLRTARWLEADDAVRALAEDQS